jgi:hypothetical protein
VLHRTGDKPRRAGFSQCLGDGQAQPTQRIDRVAIGDCVLPQFECVVPAGPVSLVGMLKQRLVPCRFPLQCFTIQRIAEVIDHRRIRVDVFHIRPGP